MAPQEVVSSLGADVLRLWVASSDYREDIRLSPAILNQVAEVYRKIRNTLRFCLANVADFKMEEAVPAARMEELDRWILSSLSALVEEVTQSYQAYAFHRVVKSLHEFCTVRLSNFYLDVIKDTLYTSFPKEPRRLSAQTALVQLAQTLVCLIAPILPMTAEEAWGALERENQSVHLGDWPDPATFPRDEKLEESWGRLLGLRDEAMKSLEKARMEGLIGDPLQAHLEVLVRDEDLWKFLEPRGEIFATACIVSSLKMSKGSGDGAPLTLSVTKAPGAKCQRCWMVLPTVGQSREHPQLCHRCVEVLNKLTHSTSA